MDAVKFIEERKRLCGTHVICKDCPANGNQGCIFNLNGGADADEQVNLLEEWVAAHSRKTRQSEFLKMFPNALLYKDSIDCCPRMADQTYTPNKRCTNTSCIDCKKEFWLAEVEE